MLARRSQVWLWHWSLEAGWMVVRRPGWSLSGGGHRVEHGAEPGRS